jgi:PAS domain S-box-containing protein
MEEFNAILKEKAQLDRGLGQLKAAIKKTMEAFSQGIEAGGTAGSLEQLLNEGAIMPEQLQDLLHNAEIGAIVCDTQETIAAISHNLIAVLGYAHEELIGAYKGMLWVERPRSQETGQLLSAADYVYNIYKVKQKYFSAIHEDAYITRDGRVIPVLQHQINLLSKQGAVVGVLYLVINLSEEKSFELTVSKILHQMQRELLNDEELELTAEMKRYLSKDILETKEYLNNILETSIDGILITSASGHILGCNQSFRKMVGYAEEELVNQPVTTVSPLTGTYQTVSGKPYSITEYDVQVMADTLAALFAKERSDAGFQYFKDRNGVLIPTEVNLSLLKNREGEVIGILRNIHNLTERERLQQKIKELSEFYRLDNIVGKSRSMQEIFRLLKKVAESESTVLIQGESGTGKELIARAIYHYSPRFNRPFVILNCGAIPANLLESELFGHVKGSFTGAIRDKKGLFEEADGGVIFLDEIGELPLDMQVKLLRVLQQRETKRVGDNRTITIDVRIIAASNKDLLQEIKKGLFREDLYYRINVFTMKIPPLRERKEDIPLLVDFFLKKDAPAGNLVQVARDARKILLNYPFPGNVRELENIIERALILCENNVITVSDLPPEMVEAAQDQLKKFRMPAAESPIFKRYVSTHEGKAGQPMLPEGRGLRQVLLENRKRAEKDMILKALSEAHNNKVLAAKILKIGRTSLYRKMKQLGIE